ncbi:MAG: hypothetical protein E7463_13980 [Ruminococcaceae bacterium]|nr:hypothetical protein [Oscillospiraceae bacterium]
MKRSVIILLVLLILGGTALGYLHTGINAVREDVVFTEKQLLGDRTAAEGLRIDTGANYHDQLHWDSATRFTADSHTTDTDYHFTYTREYSLRQYELSGLILNNFTDYHLNMDADIEDLSGITLAYRELFDATAPGTESEAVINLADYYDYFPMEISLDLTEFGFSGRSFENDYILDDPDIYNVTGDQQYFNQLELLLTLHEYFRIPVPKNHVMTINIERSVDGHHTSWGSSWGTGGSSYSSISTVTQAAATEVPTAPLASPVIDEEEYDFYDMYSWCITTDDAMYFSFYNRTRNGHTVDTSLIPGGYGIYRLPYGKVENDQLVFCDQLSTVFSLPADANITDMAEGRDNTILLTNLNDDGTYTMTVIDIATMEVIDVLDLPYVDEIYDIRYFDDFIFCRTRNDYFLLIEQSEDRTVELRIYAESMPEELEAIYRGYYYNYCSMDWDGERLAMAYWLTVPETYRESCGFYLAVYDASGLIYYGEYANSLTPWYDPVGYTAEYCSADGSRGITVEWE